MKWTIPASMSVYAFTLFGSMASYYIATEVLSLAVSNQIEIAGFVFQIGLIWVLNYAVWGGLNYFGQKQVAFKEVSTSPLLES